MEDAPKPDWPWCIPLRAKDGHVRAWTLVDEEDYWWLGDLPCCLATNRYAQASFRGHGYGRGGGGQVFLHRVIMGLPKRGGGAIDHINGDRLDNRRSNLRRCTQAQNRQNVVSYGKTSSHRGVSWSKDRQAWVANAKLDGRQYNLGRYDDESEAARVAADFRRQHMQFAVDR